MIKRGRHRLFNDTETMDSAVLCPLSRDLIKHFFKANPATSASGHIYVGWRQKTLGIGSFAFLKVLSSMKKGINFRDETCTRILACSAIFTEAASASAIIACFPSRMKEDGASAGAAAKE